MALIQDTKPWLVQPQYPAITNSGEFKAVFSANTKNGGATLTTEVPRATVLGVGTLLTLGSAETRAIAPSISVGASWSILIVIRPESKANLYPYIIGISGAANAFGLAWNHGSFAGRPTWYDGTSVQDSGITLPIGETHVVGLTYNATGNIYSWFKDGVGGNSYAGVNTGTGSWQFAAATSEGSTVVMPALAFADAVISPARMKELTANPWQLFEPLNDEIWIAAATTGAIATNTSNNASSSASLTIATALAANTGNQASAAANLSITTPLSTTAANQASSSAALTIATALSTSASNQASSAASLSIATPLATNTVNAATSAANLTGAAAGALATVSANQATSSAALTIATALQAGTANQAASSAALTIATQLATAVANQAASSAALTIATALTTQASNQASSSATLTASASGAISTNTSNAANSYATLTVATLLQTVSGNKAGSSAVLSYAGSSLLPNGRYLSANPVRNRLSANPLRNRISAGD